MLHLSIFKSQAQGYEILLLLKAVVASQQLWQHV